jgi:toxin ParE1/3/4
MRAVRVRYTRRALRDLDGIHSYIAKDNPAAAARVVARIRSAADTLEQFPCLGHAGLVPDTLELAVVGLPYVVVYRVKCLSSASIMAGSNADERLGTIHPAVARRGQSR